MMGREFEKILKSKLYETKPPSDFIPDWDKFLEFKRKKEIEQRRRVLGIALRFAAGFTILFGVGLGVYQFAFRDTVPNELAVVSNKVETVADEKTGAPTETISREDAATESNVETPNNDLSGTPQNGLLESNPSGTVQDNRSDNAQNLMADATLKDIEETDTYPVKQSGKKENRPDGLEPEIGHYSLGPQLISGIVVEKESIQTNDESRTGYDIDDYLREFNELYPEEGEKEPSKWSTGLFANALASNVTGLVSDRDYSVGYDYANTKYFNSSYNNEALYTKGPNTYNNNVIAIDGQTLYSKPLKHKPPLTFSATLGWNIAPKIEIETGLVYSYLYSYYSEYSNFNSYFQKVHYLGIPLSAAYYYLPEKSKFNLYNIGGIMLEKNISATGIIKTYQNAELQESEKEKINSPHIMLSANVGIGLGYDLVPSLGLFAETYASYYIYKEGQPITFKTANPFNVNLRLGMRYIFNAK